MRHHGRRLVGLIGLALVSLLSVSACILVPVDDGRGRRDRGDWRSEDRRDDDRRGDDRHDGHGPRGR
jgi:hypothetical protein